MQQATNPWQGKPRFVGLNAWAIRARILGSTQPSRQPCHARGTRSSHHLGPLSTRRPRLRLLDGRFDVGGMQEHLHGTSPVPLTVCSDPGDDAGLKNVAHLAKLCIETSFVLGALVEPVLTVQDTHAVGEVRSLLSAVPFLWGLPV